MGIRETWNELGTAGKVAVGFGIAVALFVVAMVVLLILAAVLSTFVLGLGSSTAPDAPSADFGFEHDDAAFETTIQHEAGNTIDASNLEVVVEGRRVPWTDDDGEVRAGDSITVDSQPGDRITVVYEGDDGTTQTMASFTVPE